MRETGYVLVLAGALGTMPLFSQLWVAQGPGPILNGQEEGLPNNPVSGGINAIAANPSNADVVYLGAVNGGIWKTTNATAASPTWTPLTDTLLSALSINSMAVSPLDANTIYVGTGSTSSDAFLGSAGFGVAKSTDGGSTWNVLAGSTFAGRRINSIVPTTLASGQVVLAATLFDGGGLWRSADSGVTWTRMSTVAGSGLPTGGVSSLVADPGNANRYYAAVPSNNLSSGTAGIYETLDGGQTWSLVNGAIPANILNNSFRILLSVSPASPNPVYLDPA
jgi:hypothetical protein